jgi:hypothetical protein
MTVIFSKPSCINFILAIVAKGNKRGGWGNGGVGETGRRVGVGRVGEC